MKKGDRVIWRYWHVIGRNGHWAVKSGTFIGQVKGSNLVRVHFDGNKTDSRVTVANLRHEVEA